MCCCYIVPSLVCGNVSVVLNCKCDVAMLIVLMLCVYCLYKLTMVVPMFMMLLNKNIKCTCLSSRYQVPTLWYIGI